LRSSRSADTASARISCIIPVHNESKRIRGVLAAVVGHPLISEVIVVDDASTDGTSAIVRDLPGVRLIALKQNRGKSGALRAGFQESTGSLLLLVDGDLTGLTAAHITALILPVAEGRADISISLRENTPRLWKLIGLDYISGERVFFKDLLDNRLEALPKFGFEVYLNDLCIQRKSRIAIVSWNGVQSPFKTKKYGFLRGAAADMRMISDIFRTVSPFGVLRQIFVMLRLRVN
jgi:glycosyltransferase involved in cell wall biosynthesis